MRIVMTKTPSGSVESRDEEYVKKCAKDKFNEVAKATDKEVNLTRTELPYICLETFKRLIQEAGWLVMEVTQGARGAFGKANPDAAMCFVFVLKETQYAQAILDQGKPHTFFK